MRVQDMDSLISMNTHSEDCIRCGIYIYGDPRAHVCKSEDVLKFKVGKINGGI